MSGIKELLDKTGVLVKGINMGVNEYVKEDTKKSYWSVDLMVKGHKQVITLDLPDGTDKSKLIEGEVIGIPVKVSVFNNKTRFTSLLA